MGSIDVRKQKNGQISYRARVRRVGFADHTASFQSRQEAREWIRLIEADFTRKKYFPSSRSENRERHKVSEVIDRYLGSIMPFKKIKTQIHQIQQLNWWKSQIGELFIEDISSKIVGEYRDKLQKRFKGASTVRRYLFVLSHLFSICIKEWEILESNPVMRVSKPREPRGRTRFLSQQEKTRLYYACNISSNSDLLTIVTLALSTGGRKNEILQLKWTNVDLERNLIYYIETKNDTPRSIPLTGLANGLLRMKPQVGKFVFPSRKGDKPIDFRGAWEAARERADLKDFRFHDLRHTFASYLAMNGASLLEIAELLGHKKLEMVKRYAHLTQDHKRSVVEKMNRSLFNESNNTEI